MANLHEVLEMEQLGIRVKLLRTAGETGGELLEMEVSGRPRGFFRQRHVHPEQTERIEVVSGAMKVGMNGRDHLLGEGQSIEIPPHAPHTQVPIGDGPGRIRIEVRPAGRTEQFLRHLALLCREGKINRAGYPRPAAASALILDYGETGHASAPSIRVQRTIASVVRGIARPYRPYRPYVFVDEWDVAAPPQAVFDALADADSYPTWWRPVYLEVESDGPPAVGSESRQHFKGRLPYHLRTRSVITEMDPPHSITAEVDGDLRGRGTWTLAPTASGTHVRFDWSVHADRVLLRVLTPLLRPLLRWNHNWAIARAMDGLEPHAQRRAERRLAAV